MRGLAWELGQPGCSGEASGRRRLGPEGQEGCGPRRLQPDPFSQESVNRLHAQMQAFVSESQRAAELEERRRYRFLAEKHLLLSNTFLQFFGRVSCGGRGQQRAPAGRALGAGPEPPSFLSLPSFFLGRYYFHLLTFHRFLCFCLFVSDSHYSLTILFVLTFSH